MEKSGRRANKQSKRNKDGISTETEGLVVLGRRLSIQDSGDKLLRLPILEGAAVDAGLLAHFKRI